MASEKYRLLITFYPKDTKNYNPITLGIELPEYNARVLMATPLSSVGLAMERAGGIILDQTAKPLDINLGGNVPR